MGTKAERAEQILMDLQATYNDMDCWFKELRSLGYFEESDREDWDRISDMLQEIAYGIGEDLAAEEEERREEDDEEAEE